MQIVKKEDLREVLKRNQSIRLCFLKSLSGLSNKRIESESADKGLYISAKTISRVLNQQTILSSGTSWQLSGLFDVDNDYFNSFGSAGNKSLKELWEAPDDTSRQLTEDFYNVVETVSRFYNVKLNVYCYIDNENLLEDTVSYKDLVIYSDTKTCDNDAIIRENVSLKNNQTLDLFFWCNIGSVVLTDSAGNVKEHSLPEFMEKALILYQQASNIFFD